MEKAATTTSRSLKQLSLLGCAMMLAFGCSSRELSPLNPCTIAGVAESVKVDNIEKVDLLIMMDNSNSMDVEQRSIAREIPSLIRILTTGDLDGDTSQDFPPVTDLNVGIITSDMGVGDNAISSCDVPEGDDGILRSNGNVSLDGCQASYPTRFFNFQPERDGDPEQFAQDVSCVAVLGTNGCGFEQQLEAVLKAVTPSSSSIAFGTGSARGHADADNAGFIREDSLLAVLMVTDEDDCSAADTDLYDMGSATYPGSLNLRCWQYPNAVYPIDRYTNGLLATRADNDLLIFAAITGIPPEVEPNADEVIDWEGILAHPDMVERQNPDEPQQLAPSCFVPGVGVAFPARRIVSVARDLEAAGANTIVQSICNESYTGAIQAIIGKIADVLGGTCLPRALTRKGDGTVSCSVVETLPMGANCDAVPGRTFRETNSDGQQVCEVVQLPSAGGASPEGQGWFYDDFSSDTLDRCPAGREQRIAFTVPPMTGTVVGLECLQNVSNNEEGTAGVGTGCAGSDICARPSLETRSLFGEDVALTCDGATNTCQVACGSDADCAGGYACAEVAETGTVTGNCAGGTCYCVNPTCGQ